ncbi:MAG: DUF4215 domain-containing protein [Deltaproteobacteria bacterium]|nr:DUF4215 domain-containing protein [Deltaproteobacteria bacterium]
MKFWAILLIVLSVLLTSPRHAEAVDLWVHALSAVPPSDLDEELGALGFPFNYRLLIHIMPTGSEEVTGVVVRFDFSGSISSLRDIGETDGRCYDTTDPHLALCVVDEIESLGYASIQFSVTPTELGELTATATLVDSYPSDTNATNNSDSFTMTIFSPCGDGTIDAGAGEGCDDGNMVNGDGCDANCTTTSCGNGIQTVGEACDDGNVVNGDGCNDRCEVTFACSDGVDNDTDGLEDIADPGCYTGGNITVAGDYHPEDNDETHEARCGNGAVGDLTTEICDDGNAVDGDGCDLNCTATSCGNGIRTAGEACDDGDSVDTDACRNNCTLPRCGDGIASTGEACDDGNTTPYDGCDMLCQTEPEVRNRRWNIQTIDDGTDEVGKYSSLALGPEGRSYIAYYRDMTNDLMYLKKRENGSWGQFRVTATGSGYTGKLRIVGERMHFLYSRAAVIGEDNLFHQDKPLVGSLSAVSSFPGQGNAADLGLTPWGSPVVTFKKSGSGSCLGTTVASERLALAWREGTTWHCAPITPYSVAGVQSLVVDPTGAIHIVYSLTSEGRTILGYRKSSVPASDGSYSWAGSGTITSTNLLLSGDPSPHTISLSIDVDAANQAHTCYYSSYSHALFYARFESGSWIRDRIDGTLSSYDSNDVGRDCQIAVDRTRGIIHVSYYDNEHHTLKYAQRPLAGRSWAKVTVDSPSGIDVGKYNSLEIDSQGLAHISYYDATNKDLKYATNAGICGNQVLELPEGCDDGNTNNGDSCSAACEQESESGPRCGNATVEIGESCDDGNAVSEDGCSASCQREAVCGNRTVEWGETCDDGNSVSGDRCDSYCLVEPPTSSGSGSSSTVTGGSRSIGGSGGGSGSAGIVATVFEPSGAFYNQIPSPQFQIEEIDPADGAEHWVVANGLIGDGSGYFCSPYRSSTYPLTDEFNAYQDAMGERVTHPDHHSTGFRANAGSYRLYRLTDHCRIEGCGAGVIVPDQQTFLLGIPQVAMSCYPIGKQEFYGDISYEDLEARHDALDDSSRNNWWDNSNFLFGRYLLKKLPVDEVTSSLTLLDDETELLPSGFNYFECPYSKEHLVHSFTCAELAKIDWYKKNNPRISWGTNSGRDGEINQEARIFFKTLLTQAKDRIGAQIADRTTFTDTYQTWGGGGLTNLEREMAEIVINAYNILDDMTPRLVGANCSGFVSCLAETAGIYTGNKIRLKQGPVVRGAIVKYDDTEHDNQFIIRSDIAGDCQAKRALNSDARFNVSDCIPSYGRREDGGIVEDYFPDDPGVEIYDPAPAESGPHFLASRPAPAVKSAPGYACLVAGKLAHQMIHAYFLRTLGHNRMESYPSPEALWEEEQANMTEALVIDALTALNYCPGPLTNTFQKEDFVRSTWTTRYGTATGVGGGNRGKRFYYPSPPVGYDGIFLGPFYTNMSNIAYALYSHDPESARNLALHHAICPILDPPSLMNNNGLSVVPFSLPEPADSRSWTDHPINERNPPADQIGRDQQINRLRNQGGKR